MNQISRRNVLKGAAIAGLPLANLLADPVLAAAAAAETEMVSLTSASGRSVSGALALPATLPAPTILLIHEWWGLNDQIKTMALEFARKGYVALACDLYDGKLAKAGNRDAAESLMKAVDNSEATETVATWVNWLRDHEHSTGKVGTVGWCFGGGWSLNTGIATPVDATVVYYGRVNKTAAELAPLRGPVQGHFATRDKWINKDMVDGFEAAMDKAGKAYETHWYKADHAFANPSSGRYDEKDAATAWQRTIEFLGNNLS